MRSWISVHVLQLVFGAAIGPLAYFLGRQLLNLRTWIDHLPAWAKRVTILALSILIAAAFQVLGLELPPSCAAITSGELVPDCLTQLSAPAVLKGVLGAAIALLMHELKKQPPQT